MGKKKKLKLHIGCGNIYKKGYVNIDAYNTGAADLNVLADKLPFPDNSVELIENYHLLEHLSRLECLRALKEWYRVLKPNGKLIIEVPNLIKHMDVFLKSDYKERWEIASGGFNHGLIQAIYGLGGKKGQYHKTGFDKQRLKNLLEEHNFFNIKVFYKKGTRIARESIVAVCQKQDENLKTKKKQGKEEQSSDKIKRTRLNCCLHKIKIKIVYILRYLADSIDRIEIHKFFK